MSMACASTSNRARACAPGSALSSQQSACAAPRVAPPHACACACFVCACKCRASAPLLCLCLCLLLLRLLLRPPPPPSPSSPPYLLGLHRPAAKPVRLHGRGERPRAAACRRRNPRPPSIPCIRASLVCPVRRWAYSLHHASPRPSIPPSCRPSPARAVQGAVQPVRVHVAAGSAIISPARSQTAAPPRRNKPTQPTPQPAAAAAASTCTHSLLVHVRVGMLRAAALPFVAPPCYPPRPRRVAVSGCREPCPARARGRPSCMPA